MFNTVNTIFFIYRPNGFFNQRFVGVLDDSRYLLCPKGPESSFDFGEGELNWIVPWGVRQVENVPEPELPHLRF